MGTSKEVAGEFKKWAKDYNVKPTAKVFITFLDTKDLVPQLHDETKLRAISHYDDMIEYVEVLILIGKGEDYPNPDQLLNTIGGTWDGRSCSYCAKYHEPNDCTCCPLFKEYVSNDFSKCCCTGLWLEMAHSYTWNKWLVNAKNVRSFIIEKG